MNVIARVIKTMVMVSAIVMAIKCHTVVTVVVTRKMVM